MQSRWFYASEGLTDVHLDVFVFIIWLLRY